MEQERVVNKKKIAKTSESEEQHAVRRHTRRNTYGIPDKSKRRRIINQKGASGRPEGKNDARRKNHVFEKRSKVKIPEHGRANAKEILEAMEKKIE